MNNSSSLAKDSNTNPSARKALVLMGGGARTAYQAGVLDALRQIMHEHGEPSLQKAMPFQILVGTSAGAMNVSFLASRAQRGLVAFEELAHFWAHVRSHQVYRLNVPHWMRFSRLITAWYLSRQVRQRGALLDNMPMTDLLHKSISLTNIDEALAQGALHALAVTASSYSSGVHWTFCHTHHDAEQRIWSRIGRRAEFQPVTMEHLMASSAIPLLFPARPLWVDGHSEYFGDGSMRQTSPLSPAMHLGATKIFVIGVGQPERAGVGAAEYNAAQVEAQTQPQSRPNATKNGSPSFGGVIGHALASVFHDTLRSDIEQALRMNETLDELPPDVAARMPYRRVEIMGMQPSTSIDQIAREHAHALPSTVRGVLSALAGKHGASGTAAELASYLLFEPEFTQALIELGKRDAWAQKDALLAFLTDDV